MLLAIWFMLLLSVPLVLGQFPAVCNTPDSLNAKECCPNDCSGRGNCMNITDEVVMSWDAADRRVVVILRDGPRNETWPLDVRYQWPLRVFERVCSCSTGWGGYDCSRCDFGYVLSGDTCVEQTDENQLLVRRNFSALSLSERREYIDVIRAAKKETEKWAVIVGEPARTNVSGFFELQNVSTYDMFVTLHALSAREQDTKDCEDVLGNIIIDFAHQNSTFLTWHRYYLLIVESELRRVAEEMNITNFTLPYWDWRPMDEAEIFNDDLFGAPPLPYMTNRRIVEGNLFNSGDWPIVCDQHYRDFILLQDTRDDRRPCRDVRMLCNVRTDSEQNYRLERGKIRMKDYPFLPDEESIIMALAANDNNDNDGFRKRLEGFVDLCPGQQCIIRNPRAQEGGPPHNNLHNAVHIFLGGHMRVVPSASNDPIFFLHHANIDRLFESWLRKFTDANLSLPDYSIINNGHPGHNLNDSLVPFFPLKTNADMYKVSSELGYLYNRLQENIPSTDFETCSANISCIRGGYRAPAASPTPTPTTSTTDSSNSIYHIQLYLLLFGVAIAAILM